VLAEVVYNPAADPDELQWVKLYNPCPNEIDLADYTLAWGGTFYSEGGRSFELSGMVASGDCFITGGPTSSVLNGDPTIDLGEDFSPSFDVAAVTGNGAALYNLPASSIDGNTTPLDAVIYGDNNDNDLLDSTGVAPADAMVANPAMGGSIQRDDETTWSVSVSAAPNTCPTF
jgi:hypothetical protein